MPRAFAVLILITSSNFTHGVSLAPLIHDDADARQLSSGDAIKIYNARGSLGQGRISPTTCRQVWPGFTMDGLALIISHLAMRF
jgi:hypothetical protein